MAKPTPILPRIRTAINCPAVCTSGISRVNSVVVMMPACIRSLRLKRSFSSEPVNTAATTTTVGTTTSQGVSAAVRCSGPRANTSSAPVIAVS